MILVICPSRGRPDKAQEAAESLINTRRLDSTEMLVVVDYDDPRLLEYTSDASFYRWLQVKPARAGMVAALNLAAKIMLGEGMAVRPDIIGFVGDDHRFLTDGWDVAIREALVEPGFAFGYDKFWHQGQIPTQIFISRPIVEALGYFALPDCHHLFVDNAWMALGQATQSIHWLPNVVIEHMHPAVQKAEWDEGYLRVNAPEMYDRDGAAFNAWVHSERFREDVAKVRAITEAASPVA